MKRSLNLELGKVLLRKIMLKFGNVNKLIEIDLEVVFENH